MTSPCLQTDRIITLEINNKNIMEKLDKLDSKVDKLFDKFDEFSERIEKRYATKYSVNRLRKIVWGTIAFLLVSIGGYVLNKIFNL